MAIGTAAAIGLGVAGVGALASSSSSNSASRRAAETSQANNDANTALIRESRDMSLERLDPYVNRGNAAGDRINELLGLTQPQPQQQVQPNAFSQFQPSGFAGNIDPDFRRVTNGAGLPYGIGDNFIRTGTFNNGSFTQTRPTALQQPGLATPQGNPQQDAFAGFREGTGYKFRLNEGMDALNSGWAAAGTLQSGAAAKDAIRFGQNFGSNEFSNYLGALQSQQAVGAGSASSSASVSQNFGNTVAAQNNFNAQNQMNAQLGRQDPFANVLGTIGGGILSYGVGG